MPQQDHDREYGQLILSSLGRTIDFLKFAEAKNAASLTFASAWALGITNTLSGNRVLSSGEAQALGLSRFLFVLAIVVAAWSFLPRLRGKAFHRGAKQPPNLLYFGDIAAYELEAFKMHLDRAYRGDSPTLGTERYLDDLRAQLWINSRIAHRKFRIFGMCMLLTFAALIIAMAPAMMDAMNWITVYLSDLIA